MAVANTVYASTAICASIDLIAFAVNSAKDSFDCYLQSFLSLHSYDFVFHKSSINFYLVKQDRGYSWGYYIYSIPVRYTALDLSKFKSLARY